MATAAPPLEAMLAWTSDASATLARHSDLLHSVCSQLPKSHSCGGSRALGPERAAGSAKPGGDALLAAQSDNAENRGRCKCFFFLQLPATLVSKYTGLYFINLGPGVSHGPADRTPPTSSGTTRTTEPIHNPRTRRVTHTDWSATGMCPSKQHSTERTTERPCLDAHGHAIRVAHAFLWLPRSRSAKRCTTPLVALSCPMPPPLGLHRKTAARNAGCAMWRILCGLVRACVRARVSLLAARHGPRPRVTSNADHQ